MSIDPMSAATVFEPPRTVFGPGAIQGLRDELAALGVRRALLITDRGLVAAGIARGVSAHLPADTPCFADVTPNPVFADAMAALQQYQDSGCDSIVALGGGSVIDTAKYVALLATHGGHVSQYVNRPAPFSRAAAPLVAIPTTAGTGSEASPDAGIHADAHSVSSGITSRWAVPRVAVLDSQLTTGLPPRLTAATGIDALSHCIEGFLSRTDSLPADALSLDGIRRVMTHLEQATRHGDDLTARGEMLMAGYLGGLAIGMGLGPAHALAISCGDQGLHHGLLSGIGCVITLDAVLAHVPGKRAALCTAMGLAPDASPGAAIAALMRRLDLPATLRDAGYRTNDAAALARRASESVFNLSSRWHPQAVDYLRLIDTSLAGHVAPSHAF